MINVHLGAWYNCLICFIGFRACSTIDITCCIITFGNNQNKYGQKIYVLGLSQLQIDFNTLATFTKYPKHTSRREATDITFASSFTSYFSPFFFLYTKQIRYIRSAPSSMPPIIAGMRNKRYKGLMRKPQVDAIVVPGADVVGKGLEGWTVVRTGKDDVSLTSFVVSADKCNCLRKAECHHYRSRWLRENQ